MEGHVCMKRLRSGFTMIELVMVMAIMVMLASILLPSLRSARARAKFARWYAYNQHWNRDGDSVVNYNFQDNKKDPFAMLPLSKVNYVTTLRNGAEGCDWNNGRQSFNARDYDGKICSISSSMTAANSDAGIPVASGYGGLYQAGRWGKYKQALYFDGSTVVVASPQTSALQTVNTDAILNSSSQILKADYSGNSVVTSTDLSGIQQARDALDFTANDSFTIIAWIKFQTAPTSLQFIYSRAASGLSGVSNPHANGFACSQFDLMTDINGNAKGGFDIDVSTNCISYPNAVVNFKDTSWKQVVLRYEVKGNKGYISSFYNGEMVAGGTSANYTSGSITVSANPGGRGDAPTVIGSEPWYGYPTPNKYDMSCPFIGYMDEFMIVKRALSPSEIKGNYLMGSE